MVTKTYKVILGVCLAAALGAGCKKFDSLQTNPENASDAQVLPEYFLNASIIGAQMNPDVAERSFVLYWKTAGHQTLDDYFVEGQYDEGWTESYYLQVTDWLNKVYKAVDLCETDVKNGSQKAYTNNLLQISRIWRAYLLTEMSDNFGPVPLNGFAGTNPTYSGVKDVYYYVLAELKDAASKLETGTAAGNIASYDAAYGGNAAMWQKFANSLRMRCAMRLSEVDATKAQQEFEDAATKPFIAAPSDNFKVQEKPGWDALTGVMTREWDTQELSATLNNLFVGLGGIKSTDQVADSIKNSVKPDDYMGIRYENQFSTKSNDPSQGYWLDGLPNVIDPRAYKSFAIPGDFNNPDFCFYPSWNTQARTLNRDLLDGTTKVATINAKNTWNAFSNGEWGAKGVNNKLRFYPGVEPRLVLKFRNSTNQRLFFADWESYFLIAEAGVRGWKTPMGARAAYEKGIAENFAYWGVESYLPAYLSSTTYNRAGTSVSWSHTAEPVSKLVKFTDGYSKAQGTVTFNYPVNSLYKSGSVHNDLLTKVITQKFIANNPYLPLEAWSDHRRLGLPFFENPAVEAPIATMPALNNSNYMTGNVKFFPQRLKYPSLISGSNPQGYASALTALGGEDAVLTPLWWAKKN